MSINNLGIVLGKSVVKLPDWIKFAFGLGAYINDHGVKYKKPLNLILSLPSERYFSLLIAMGIVDKKFYTNNQMWSIRKRVLNLVQGNRIIYKDEQSSRKVSVICIEPSPVFQNEMILKVKDGRMERGIPESQWEDKVIILDEEFDEIKRTRKVNKNQKLGLDNNRLLSAIYSPVLLNTVVFYPGDTFYLVGNMAQTIESMNEKIFSYNGVQGAVGDFLYLDNNNSYTNGKLFSSRMKITDIELSKEIPVIYSDLNSYIKQDKYFTKNPKIILSSRADNESRLHLVKEELRRKMIQGDYNIVTNEVIDYLNFTETPIPLGIEFLGWR
ncbi:hypothetical protein COL47_01090 [Bacillus toyonensis]|uniref:hypothetical protein n=1 Tax=Bacillus toyonensis TaxID=155322 RepID=UPI000BF4BC16|nr:hypothetical protein [Bacillus toyonensis]PFY25326.1 hypothetical protein COL47_01090 [Bacillus toyonensis]PGA32533.1 hypothetical protein COL81_29055 [Bacillus toyonensis]